MNAEEQKLSPENVRRLRETAGYKKLAPAARDAQINRRSLIGLESGEIKDPSHRVLSSLARVFKCEISDFYQKVPGPADPRSVP
ncbi:helix-turn-helix transcriptional regulator [Deinococcus sp. 6YEL10]|uniref:helix-turn-helix domain-containing protein n=1 Tax=Deinococcus sp. 6YEL10 TaxID=2745870 RepID=UPI001E547A3C|nr:helix-turn-helix transcriptional regulator [Deinococcus sp. 6YEL10]MCD0160113.1 helix-turn-helix transcriptional regulator [Deinococcus sp. 6YEL10]